MTRAAKNVESLHGPRVKEKINKRTTAADTPKSCFCDKKYLFQKILAFKIFLELEIFKTKINKRLEPRDREAFVSERK